jgi:hypothetical protein
LLFLAPIALHKETQLIATCTHIPIVFEQQSKNQAIEEIWVGLEEEGYGTILEAQEG